MSDPMDELRAQERQAAAKSRSRATQSGAQHDAGYGDQHGPAEQVGYAEHHETHDSAGGYDQWDRDDDTDRVDRVVATRFWNLEQALIGDRRAVGAQDLYWDGTRDQTGAALRSILGDLLDPGDRPDSDLPREYRGNAQTGS